MVYCATELTAWEGIHLMANQLQVEILKNDIQLFNSLRKNVIYSMWKTNRETVDLSKEDFMNIDLSDVDLCYTNLSNVDLHGANLHKTNLTEANLHYANLVGANLSGAILLKANLSKANLFSANLSGAICNEANFGEANLGDANLCGANLSKAKFEKTDLSKATLNETDLGETNFHSANLMDASLYKANLYGADLIRTNLSGANLREANLYRADLSEAQIYDADLFMVNLSESCIIGANIDYSDLSEANLTKSDISYTKIINTKINNAIICDADLSCSSMINVEFLGSYIENCRIFGISIWNINTDKKTKQSNLIITNPDEPMITIDNLELAQFIYLLLNNKKVREIINTITSKVVLILGRFSETTKPILNTLRDELQKYNYTPVMFDFDKPSDRNFIETVSTLAHMAKFVIADFTDPKIVLQEAEHIVHNIAIPFAPIYLKDSGFEPVTLYDLRKGRTYVLDTFCYENIEHLLRNLEEMVIKPAEKLVGELNKENPIK